MFENLKADEILDIIRYLNLDTLITECLKSNDDSKGTRTMSNKINYELEVSKCEVLLKRKVKSLRHLTENEKISILSKIHSILKERNSKMTFVPKEKISLIQRYTTFSGFVDNERKLFFKSYCRLVPSTQHFT